MKSRTMETPVGRSAFTEWQVAHWDLGVQKRMGTASSCTDPQAPQGTSARSWCQCHSAYWGVCISAHRATEEA
jgi:hypothetical protein